jgi:FtsP/CotA-like multicopper oxidase with cupredoxin domain
MLMWVRRRRTSNQSVPQDRRNNKYLPNLETLEDRLVPAVFTVHNAAQLAAAITAADGAPGSTINLTPGTSASYLLTSALPAITANTTLQGTGAKATQVVVDGQNVAGSDFSVTKDLLTVTFKNMEITGGNSDYGGGIFTGSITWS